MASKRNPRRGKNNHNPAGSKLIKSFIKGSKEEFPAYIAVLQALNPKDPFLRRYGIEV